MKLSANPSHRVDKSGKRHGAEYHCPISTLEMNGRHKFGFILQTGTVLSERAIKQLAKSSGDGTIIDPHDDKKYKMEDIIYINIGFTLEDEAEFEEMKKAVRRRREAKKNAKAEKRKAEGGVVEKVKGHFVSVGRKSFNSVKRKEEKTIAHSATEGRNEHDQLEVEYDYLGEYQAWSGRSDQTKGTLLVLFFLIF